MKTIKEQIRGGIIGVAVGDALGVPYEFLDRNQMDKKPAKEMIGYGTHHQPAGTWSDDSSLTFCLLESLSKGYDIEDIASTSSNWLYESYWTARGDVFDIGITTKNAIYKYRRGIPPHFCGDKDEYANGNGSLMRILPLAYYLQQEQDISSRYEQIKEVASITHGHFRAIFACFIYIEYALVLLTGMDKHEAYQSVKKKVVIFVNQQQCDPQEINLFAKILENDIGMMDRSCIQGSGYVLHSLEAAFWCLLTSASYEESVLKAVNLGEDTDTTAAITGGLAGIYFGIDAIPETWQFQLARYEDIENLIERFADSLSK